MLALTGGDRRHNLVHRRFAADPLRTIAAAIGYGVDRQILWSIVSAATPSLGRRKQSEALVRVRGAISRTSTGSATNLLATWTSLPLRWPLSAFECSQGPSRLGNRSVDSNLPASGDQSQAQALSDTGLVPVQLAGYLLVL